MQWFRVDLKLIFKSVRGKKKSILNENPKNYPRQIRHPVIDLKMGLLLKIVKNFKLSTVFTKTSILGVSQLLSSSLTAINQTFLTNNKRAISRAFGALARITQPWFYLFKVKKRNTKSTRGRCEMCLELNTRV